MIVDYFHLFELVIDDDFSFQHRPYNQITCFNNLLKLFIFLKLHVDQSHFIFFSFRIDFGEIVYCRKS
jgi:hypothetical protein